MSASSIGYLLRGKCPAFEVSADQTLNIPLPRSEGNLAFEVAVQFEIDSGDEVLGQGNVFFDRPNGLAWAGHG
jgi:hypothetical protein